MKYALAILALMPTLSVAETIETANCSITQFCPFEQTCRTMEPGLNLRLNRQSDTLYVSTTFPQIDYTVVASELLTFMDPTIHALTLASATSETLPAPQIIHMTSRGDITIIDIGTQERPVTTSLGTCDITRSD